MGCSRCTYSVSGRSTWHDWEATWQTTGTGRRFRLTQRACEGAARAAARAISSRAF
ncbi:MAG: hypothetical protein EOP17_09915 [Rhizobiaceae bacterium]|nr:MAG: hypothetical protein EOP17_09915 [Rhizobiaceae bacterium]